MKRGCAKEASKLVPNQGIIGLGGGETIGYLAEYIKEQDKKVEIVTPSAQTENICHSLGLQVLDLTKISQVQIAFDGCDQVDYDLNAYKSGGGIHTLEKIIAKMSKEYVLLVDESKVVGRLNNRVPLVLEIVPEAVQYVTSKAKCLGGKVKVRDKHLLEVFFEGCMDLQRLDEECKAITGVVETSLFYQIATKAVVAGKQGITVMEKENKI